MLKTETTSTVRRGKMMIFVSELRIAILFLIVTIASFYIQLTSATRVFELSDRFAESYTKDGRSWLIKFYAPWCHYCRQLEPVYNLVAQQLAHSGSDVIVGKIDATKYPSITQKFPVRGYPTILFINQEKVIEFEGDRNREELIDFALRMEGPRIRQMLDCADVIHFLEKHKVFFLNVGQEMKVPYEDAAELFHPASWMYQINSTSCPHLKKEGVYAIKGKPDLRMDVMYDPLVHESLNKFIKRNRFPSFVRVVQGNINSLLRSGKALVIGIVEYFDSTGKMASGKHDELLELMESIAYAFTPQDVFQFGWCSNIGLVNPITLHSITQMPAVLVINASNFGYHLMQESLLPQDILSTLDEMTKGDFVFSGGNGWWTTFKRQVLDGVMSLIQMYMGNPVLTILLLGLPCFFLSFIVYSAFASNMLDASDEDEAQMEEEERLLHQKTE